MTTYLEKNIIKMKNGKIINNLHVKIKQTNKGYTLVGEKNGTPFKKVVQYDECKEYGKRLKTGKGKGKGKHLKNKRSTNKRKRK
jgi:hypothetical protein